MVPIVNMGFGSFKLLLSHLKILLSMFNTFVAMQNQSALLILQYIPQKINT